MAAALPPHPYISFHRNQGSPGKVSQKVLLLCLNPPRLPPTLKLPPGLPPPSEALPLPGHADLAAVPPTCQPVSMLCRLPGRLPSVSAGRLPSEATLEQRIFKVLLPRYILLYSMQPLGQHNLSHLFTFCPLLLCPDECDPCTQ